MEAVLHQVLDRFPRLGEKIFNQLDNQNLTKCKEIDNSLNEFLKENKVLWMRMIKKYNVNHMEFKDDWKSVMEKVPVENVEELALAVEQFYTQRPYETRLSYQNSPHHFAAVCGSLSLCKLIAQKTLVLNPPRRDGLTPLHFAAQEGHFDVCKYIIDHLDGDKNPPSVLPPNAPLPPCKVWDRRTPLHEAASQGNLAVFKYIADRTSNKNPGSDNGRTPLHNAAANGHIQIVKSMMNLIEEQNKLDPRMFLLSMNKNVKDNLDLTPMHLAVQNGHYEICKVLIDYGADPNPTTGRGTSALDMAGSNKEIQDLILKKPEKI